MGLLRRVAGGALQPLLGVRRYQRMWESANRLSLQGLHVGSGAGVATRGESAFLADFIKANDLSRHLLVCMDVGANQGLWSETLIGHARSAKRPLDIIAFAPSAVACALRNLRFGNFGNREAEELALGVPSGHAFLRSTIAEEQACSNGRPLRSTT